MRGILLVLCMVAPVLAETDPNRVRVALNVQQEKPLWVGQQMLIPVQLFMAGKAHPADRAGHLVGDDIDRARAVKLGGFVNAPADFTGPPGVINGASDLLVEVFGEENGKHARFAVAVASLPGGAAVEVDAIFEIE